ncbi:MAG: UDP-3-O-acyl-N-acetylglucosamine deacetylase [Candidatus Caldatribacteriaceae bacterium]
MNNQFYQKTIKKPISLEGKGLHSGQRVRMTLFPAPENSGIFFQVIRKKQKVIIPARIQFAVHSSRSTTLAKDGISIRTVEHFLAACWGWGISNLEVVLEGEELPGGNGSAQLFYEALKEAGVMRQDALCSSFSIQKVLVVGDERRKIFAFPAETTQVFYLLDGTQKGFFAQMAKFQEGENFAFLARARTFALEWEIQVIIENNLGLGVRTEALILDSWGKSHRPLELPQEAVFHKILDFLGDLMLLGQKVQGGFLGIRSGHELNREMVKLLQMEVGKHGH